MKIKLSVLVFLSLTLFLFSGCTSCSDNHTKSEIEKACQELDDR